MLHFQLPQWDSEGQNNRGKGVRGNLSTPSMGFEETITGTSGIPNSLSTPSMGFLIPPLSGHKTPAKLSTPSMGFPCGGP